MNRKSISMSIMAVWLAFLIGYISPRVRADPPPGCPMFECKTVDAFWTGNTNTVAFAVWNDLNNARSSDGRENIFTPQSNDKLPRVFGSVAVIHKAHNLCTPWCGLDANGKWQAFQEVYIPATDPGTENFVAAVRAPCTPNGGAGPTVPNPPNANTDGKTPPGVLKEEDDS